MKRLILSVLFVSALVLPNTASAFWVFVYCDGETVPREAHQSDSEILPDDFYIEISVPCSSAPPIQQV